MDPEELVDIVDEEDHVLHACTKGEAHEQGLLHRTVIAECINSKGEWILVQQAPDRQDPGQFVSPMGGHVRAGETCEKALVREVIEELGITVSSYRLVGKKIYRRNTRGKDENHYFIVYEVFSNEEPVLNHESAGYRHFTSDQLSRELKGQPERFGTAFHVVVRTFYPGLLSNT